MKYINWQVLTIKPPQLLLLLIVFNFINRACASPIIIKGAESYTFTANSWDYFVTGQQNTSIDSIMAYNSRGLFKRTGQAVFNGGIPREYYWFHFTLTNADGQGVALVIDAESPRINEMELFEVGRNGPHSLGRAGDFFRFNQRKIAHKNFIFLSHLLGGESKEYFLYINQVGHTLILPMKVYKSEIFPAMSAKNYLVDGLTYGILVFVGILSIIFFINTRHYLYLFYSLYTLTALAWFLSYFGLGYQYIWGEHPGFSTASAPFFACLNIILNIQICQSLLHLKKNDYFIYLGGNAAKLLLLTAGLFPVIVQLNHLDYSFNHTYLLCFLTIIIFSVLVILVSVLWNVKGSVAARFYLSASILKTGSILNLALLEFGVSPGIYNVDIFLQVGILIEITLLSYALAKRYTAYRLNFFKEVIAAQEKEREKISREIHDSVANGFSAIIMSLINVRHIWAITTKTPVMFCASLRGRKNNLVISKNKLLNIAGNKLKLVQTQVENVQIEVRNISRNMVSIHILKNPLHIVIEKYINGINNRVIAPDGSIVTINLAITGEYQKFPEAMKLNIFRIVQELIENIRKHSKASSAELIFTFGEKSLLIIADDDGIGFPIIGTDEAGIGINNIRSRVKIMNGTFAVQCSGSPKQAAGYLGTLIKIKIPLRGHGYQKATEHDY